MSMNRSLFTSVFAVISAITVFAQAAYPQPAAAQNARTGSVRTHQGAPQNPPGGSTPAPQTPPAPAGGVTSQPTTGPGSQPAVVTPAEPAYDPQCDLLFEKEFIAQQRLGQFGGERKLPWPAANEMDPSWPATMDADSKCDQNRHFVDVWSWNPQDPYRYEVTLCAEWQGTQVDPATNAPKPVTFRVPLAQKVVWHEDCVRGPGVPQLQPGAMRVTLWVHETRKGELKDKRELVIEWAKMPVPLQEHLGVDAATLKRTPAAGATVRLDFSRFTKRVEEPNGWYNVRITLKEGSNELAFADKIMTSDFAENTTAVQNAEKNRVRRR